MRLPTYQPVGTFTLIQWRELPETHGTPALDALRQELEAMRGTLARFTPEYRAKEEELERLIKVLPLTPVTLPLRP